MSAIPLNLYSSFLNNRRLSIDEAAQYQILGTEPDGVRIVYKDLDDDVLIAVDGKPFERLRLYQPRGKMKYKQRAGSGTAAYLPQYPEIHWPHVALDPSIPIIFTEGEFKALETCRKWGAPTIGLGGVNSWSPGMKDPKSNLARPLDRFIWVGRKVFICYDYDGSPGGGYKPKVEAAANALAGVLNGLGAQPCFLYLGKTPLAQENVKLGLDDYIQAGGELDPLLATEVVHEGDPALTALLTRYAVYHPTQQATIIDLLDGSLQSASSWVFRNEHLNTAVRVDDKVKVRKTTELWRVSDKKIVVRGYCFRPGEPSGLTEDFHYNIWQGYAREPSGGQAGHGEAVQRWVEFGRGLFEEQWDWVEKWTAHMFQRPEEKCTITVTVMSPQEGIGKSLYGDFLHEIIGEEHARHIGTNQMFEKHSEWPRGCLLGTIDELQSGYERHEDQLKDLVSASHTWINPKGVREYKVEALFRLYFTTNRSYPFRLSADSRRHFIWKPRKMAADLEWKAFLKGVVGPLSENPQALGEIHQYLLEVNLEGFNPRGDAPWTEAREEAAGESLSNREARGSVMWDLLPDVFVLTPELKANEDFRTELRQIMKMETDHVGHVMKIDGRPVKVTVHAKEGVLPTKLVADNKDGTQPRRVLDTFDFTPERVREALKATYAALGVGNSKF